MPRAQHSTQLLFLLLLSSVPNGCPSSNDFYDTDGYVAIDQWKWEMQIRSENILKLHFLSLQAALLGGADESNICLKAARAYIPLLREHIFSQVMMQSSRLQLSLCVPVSGCGWRCGRRGDGRAGRGWGRSGRQEEGADALEGEGLQDGGRWLPAVHQGGQRRDQVGEKQSINWTWKLQLLRFAELICVENLRRLEVELCT